MDLHSERLSYPLGIKLPRLRHQNAGVLFAACVRNPAISFGMGIAGHHHHCVCNGITVGNLDFAGPSTVVRTRPGFHSLKKFAFLTRQRL